MPAGGAGGNASNVAGSTKTICTSKKSVKIVLRRPKGVRFVKAVIHVNGRKKRFVTRKFLGVKPKVTLTVKLYRTKTTKVRIVVTTASGRTLTYRQNYKRCAPSR